MAIPVWPPSLPTLPLSEGYEENIPDNTLRTSMGQGPAKVRPKGAPLPTAFSAGFLLTTEQVATFQAFVEDGLRRGALRFEWAHPRTGAAIESRIVGDGKRLYTVSHAGGQYWNVSAQFEVLP